MGYERKNHGYLTSVQGWITAAGELWWGDVMMEIPKGFPGADRPGDIYKKDPPNTSPPRGISLKEPHTLEGPRKVPLA